MFRDPLLPFAALIAAAGEETGAGTTSADVADSMRKGKMVPRRLKYLEKVLRKQLAKKDETVRGGWYAVSVAAHCSSSGGR